MKKILVLAAMVAGLGASAQSVSFSNLEGSLGCGELSSVGTNLYNVRIENKYGTFVEGGWASRSNLSALRDNNLVQGLYGYSLELDGGLVSSGLGLQLDIGSHFQANDPRVIGMVQAETTIFSLPTDYEEDLMINLTFRLQSENAGFGGAFVGITIR